MGLVVGFKKRALQALIFSILYLVLTGVFVGFRADHLTLLLLVCGLMLLHRVTYKIVLSLSGFLIFWILYDALQVVPNYTVNKVLIEELYQWELRWFGVFHGGQRMILCEWFTHYTNELLTIFCGIAYLMWMPFPMLYALILARVDSRYVFQLNYSFLLTCLIGFVGYYILPAAPPWYYFDYGSVTDYSIPGNEGLLSEFDRLVGIDIFKSIYARGTNVFCALPSLHAAYPVVILHVALKRTNKWHVLIFSLWAIGTWIGAVYSQHHYVIDVIMGIVTGLIGSWIFELLMRRWNALDRVNRVFSEALQ